MGCLGYAQIFLPHLQNKIVVSILPACVSVMQNHTSELPLQLYYYVKCTHDKYR